MSFKVKKSKKSIRKRGTTNYHGARKKWKGSGHHGGVGMAGTGKRADHKKSLIIKLYGNKYFGKQGITSKKTEKRKLKQINLGDIQKNIDTLLKKYGKENKLDLKDYKVLGDGDIKTPIIIIARGFSSSAKEKIESIGGKTIVISKGKKEVYSDKNHTRKLKQNIIKTPEKESLKRNLDLKKELEKAKKESVKTKSRDLKEKKK